MPRNTVKFALRITPKTQELVRKLCQQYDCQSQNEFIERAIHFYAGYLSSEDGSEYLSKTLAPMLQGTVHDSENRISRLLFKNAVELDMLMNVLAFGIEISKPQLRELRKRCELEVKKTRGMITFEDAISYQKSE